MKQLHAFYEEKRVGTLIKNDDEIYSFEYDSKWQIDPTAFPISLSMPLTQNTFGNKITLSYFENLLPEGEVKKHLETSHRISGVFDFLAEFGQDCAGAITLTPNKPSIAPKGKSPKLAHVPIEKVYQALSEKLSVAEIISEQNPGYLSLAGAQDKFPAIFKNNKLYLPTDGSPTTHIVKVPIWRQGVKESVFNEYYCMQLAAAVGLEVPKCHVLPGPQPLFIISRYDRKTIDKFTRRTHQQDFCQAQGYASHQKYESKDGPSLKQNYELILKHSNPKSRLPNLEAFLDWICFNLIIGNNDTHSKNISLLADGSKYRLAPFYDLLSTAIYPRLEKRFAFKIGDRDDFNKIGHQQIADMENQLGLKKNVFKKRLENMRNRIVSHHQQVAKSLKEKYPEAKIQNRLPQLIDQRIKSLEIQKALGQ